MAPTVISQDARGDDLPSFQSYYFCCKAWADPVVSSSTAQEEGTYSNVWAGVAKVSWC